MTRPPLWSVVVLLLWSVALASQSGLWTAAYLNDALLPMISGHQLLHGLWPHLHVETPVGLPYAIANALALFLSGGNPVAAAWAPALLFLLLLPALWHILSARLPYHAAAAATLLLVFFAASPVSLEGIFPCYLAWYNSASLSLLSVLLLAWLRSADGATHSWISEGLLLAVLWMLKPTAAVVALAGAAVGVVLGRTHLRHALQATGTALLPLVLLLPSGIPQAQIGDLATALHAASLVPGGGPVSRLRLLLVAGGENLFLLSLIGGIAFLQPCWRARLAILAMASFLCFASTQNHGQWLAPWLLLAPLAAAHGPVFLLPTAMVVVGLGQQMLLATTLPPIHDETPVARRWTSVPAADTGPMASFGGRLSISPRDLDRATPARTHPLDHQYAPDLNLPAGPLHALDEAWTLAQGERMLRAHARPEDRVQTAGFANPWPWALGLPAVAGPLWMDAWRTVPLDRSPQDFLRNIDLLMVPISPRIRFHATFLTKRIEDAACANGWRMVAQTHGWRLLARSEDVRGQDPCP